jgi:cardiolipin synthase
VAAKAENSHGNISSHQILTIPNFLTLIRALGIPLFLWLFLIAHRPVASFIILVIGAATDYLDGKVARALNQVSKLGAVMDPTIDRAYIAATLVALGVRHYIPWWVVLLLIARDLWLAMVLIFVKVRGGQVFEVTFLGKAATFNLLYAFPLLLLKSDHGFGRAAMIFGWSFAVWGIALYLITGLMYTFQGIAPIVYGGPRRSIE